MKANTSSENPGLSDWQVTVSQELEIIGIKQMGMEMSRTRLRPVFLSSGDLLIIIPAVSEEAASQKAMKIARRIASAGVWGMDLLDLTDFSVD